MAPSDGHYSEAAPFGTVVVPGTVYREATVGNKPEAEQLRVYLQGRVRALDPESPVLLDGFSDTGETEAMLLYRQLQADYLPIDDRRGRRMARINNIQVIGSLGVLLSAERAGIIAAVRPDMQRLSESDLYLSDALMSTVLEIAGEAAS